MGGRRMKRRFVKWGDSLLRRLLCLNRWSLHYFISQRPNFQRKRGRMPEYPELFTLWTKKDPGNVADLTRLYFMWLQVQYLESHQIMGAIAELGVYRGTTARLFHELMPERHLHLFDTFGGFDERDITDENAHSALGDLSRHFSDVTLQSVKDFVGTGARIHYHPGFFPESTWDCDPETRYALVHLDADLYAPTRAGLTYFYPRLVPGGVLIVHDCNNSYVGCRQAVDEFFAAREETPVQIPDEAGSVVVIKNKRVPSVPKTSSVGKA